MYSHMCIAVYIIGRGVICGYGGLTTTKQTKATQRRQSSKIIFGFVFARAEHNINTQQSYTKSIQFFMKAARDARLLKKNLDLGKIL